MAAASPGQRRDRDAVAAEQLADVLSRLLITLDRVDSGISPL
jgi:hypothetical protein